MTLETLAGMIEKGFEETATKRELNDGLNGIRMEMNDRFNKVDDDIRYIHGSLDVIRREIEEIKTQLNHVVYRDELEEVKARILTLEKKLARIRK